MALMILNGGRPVKCRRLVASLQGDAVWCDCPGTWCLHGVSDDYAGGPAPKAAPYVSTADQCGSGAISNEYD